MELQNPVLLKRENTLKISGNSNILCTTDTMTQMSGKCSVPNRAEKRSGQRLVGNRLGTSCYPIMVYPLDNVPNHNPITNPSIINFCQTSQNLRVFPQLMGRTLTSPLSYSIEGELT